VAVIWGWLPGILWVVFGTVLVGAVHDMSVLAVSLRHQGRSIGDLAGDMVGSRGKIIFLLIVFFVLSLAMGVFALIVAQIFVRYYPEVVIPVFGLMLIAMVAGVLVYKYRVRLAPVTVVGVALMMGLIFVGLWCPVSFYRYVLPADTRAAVEQAEAKNPDLNFAGAQTAMDYFKEEDPATGKVRNPVAAKDTKDAAILTGDVWICVLLAYAFVASVLPVWLLLQPRDYLNSWQLYIGLACLLLGVLVLHPAVVAPAVNSGPWVELNGRPDAPPPIFPMLFIVVACGAVSGFHSLVSSGTTVRQIDTERDARFIGYGGMVLEGILAVLVITACTAGIASEEVWRAQFYGGWKTAAGGDVTRKMSAFVEGGGYLLSGLYIPKAFAKSLISVVVVGFAMTTLDTATRLLRFNVEELARTFRLRFLANRYLASFIAVLAIGYFALMKVGPVGDKRPAGTLLWELFGTTNQLLAVLALMVVTIYLRIRRKPVVYTLLPMMGMLVVVASSMAIKMWQNTYLKLNLGVAIVGGVISVLTVWLLVEGILSFVRARAAARVPEAD
jgi:carbon starvation protein